MKKVYENIAIDLVFFCEMDIVRTSQNDNIESIPNFPEDFVG
jgi:hypothetical protein